MENPKFSVTLDRLVDELKLELLYGGEGWQNIKISTTAVNRPAFALTGYFEYFSSRGVQVFGLMEGKYVQDLPKKERRACFDKLFETGIPILVITRGQEPFKECLESAKKHNIVLGRTNDSSSDFIAAMTASLNVHLGARTTMHGVFVEVYGEGVLLTGDSGIGKSETAIELVKRGHRLVADDAVDIKRVSAKTLVGTAPEMIRYFLELRGIGIVDVRRIFGMGSVKPTEKVDLIIRLEQWDDKKPYDRMGIEENYIDILGINVPCLDIPVKPGRNLAVIIEVAAMNNRNKKMGHNAAKELSDKLYASMLAEQ